MKKYYSKKVIYGEDIQAQVVENYRYIVLIFLKKLRKHVCFIPAPSLSKRSEGAFKDQRLKKGISLKSRVFNAFEGMKSHNLPNLSGIRNY